MIDLRTLSTTLIKLMEHAGDAACLDDPGDVIQCPPEALRCGKYYVMGFNPGGGGGKSLRQTTKNLITAREGEPHPLLGETMWRNLDLLATRLEGAEWQRRLFITNLFPNASSGVSTWFRGNRQARARMDYVRQIWPLHQYFLSMVRPRFVIVHGQGSRNSAFRYLWEFLTPGNHSNADWNRTMAPTTAGDASIKSFQLPSLDLGVWGERPAVTFIGIRHLSYSPSNFDVMIKGLIRN